MSSSPTPSPSTFSARFSKHVEVAAQRVREVTQRGRHWFATTTTPKRVAVSLVAVTVSSATLVGLAGWSDELLALTGEVVFRVDEVPVAGSPDERTTVLDRDGNELGVLTGPENRIAVPIDDLPTHVPLAMVATEDQHFFSHEGVSVSGIARAAVTNLLAREVEQGGSTITQQYVKNALLTSERSFSRKITEATWAVRIEDKLSKREILERYVNIVYLGDGTYGVGAAANYWFGKDAREMTIADSALLAGMVRAPESTDPVERPEVAQARRDIVLDQMVAIGVITFDQADSAKQQDVADQLHITPLAADASPNAFVLEYVKQSLLDDDRLGRDRDERSSLLFGGGLTVHTTLDAGLVQIAQQTLSAHLTDPLADPMGGIVSIEPSTGAVRAIALGPKGFGPCSVSECTTTTVNPLVPDMGSPGRQVGSAFKPIVVAAALENGVGTDWHTVMDSGQLIKGCGDYRPDNYNGANGVRDLPSALAESNNVFHVKLGVATGLKDIVALAHELGISNDLNPDCSLSLGAAEIHPLDLASAYATFANGGIHCSATPIGEVVDRSGEVIIDGEPDCERVLSEETAATVTTMLRGVVEGGTAGAAAIGRPVAAKTGTTNDNLDAWLVGFTPELATATWVGFEVPKPMRGILGYRSISGGTLPATLFAEFMTAAHDGVEPSPLPRVSLARYTAPDCPAPAQDEPKNDQTPIKKPPKGKPGAQPTADDGPPPSSSPEATPEGFDPQNGTLETDTDGDSFEDGLQPEHCNEVASPEDYGVPSEDGQSEPPKEPTDEPTDEPTAEPTDAPTTEPTQEPTTDATYKPTDEPTEQPASTTSSGAMAPSA